MKKSFFLIGAICVSVLVFLSFLYVIDHKRMERNEPVVFSAWGKKYALAITKEEAIKIVREKLDEKTIATITNIENPKVEEVIFNELPSIYLQKNNILNEKIYKITFNTTQDGLLGPITFYVVKSSGEIAGMDYRE